MRITGKRVFVIALIAAAAVVGVARDSGLGPAPHQEEPRPPGGSRVQTAGRRYRRHGPFQARRGHPVSVHHGLRDFGRCGCPAL